MSCSWNWHAGLLDAPALTRAPHQQHQPSHARTRTHLLALPEGRLLGKRAVATLVGLGAQLGEEPLHLLKRRIVGGQAARRGGLGGVHASQAHRDGVAKAVGQEGALLRGRRLGDLVLPPRRLNSHLQQAQQSGRLSPAQPACSANQLSSAMHAQAHCAMPQHAQAHCMLAQGCTQGSKQPCLCRQHDGVCPAQRGLPLQPPSVDCGLGLAQLLHQRLEVAVLRAVQLLAARTQAGRRAGRWAAMVSDGCCVRTCRSEGGQVCCGHGWMADGCASNRQL